MPRVDRTATGRVADFSKGKLVTIGLIGGVFSGLLGVGGGSVVVPFLVLWLFWDEHRAAATSLAALAFAAVAGAATFGSHGNVDVARALLVGIPAVGGVLIGTRVASRLEGDVLLFLFVGLQVLIAGLMLFA